MKTSRIFYAFTVCVFLLSIPACTEQKELIVAHSTIDAKLDEECSIPITSGNGGYSVSVENENILTASVKDNAIVIKPQSKGETTVIVKDSEKLSKSLSVKVIEPYIGYMIKEREFIVDADDAHILHTIKIELEKTASLVADHIYEINRNQLRSYSVFRQDWYTVPVAGGTHNFDTESFGFTLREGSKVFVYTLEENNPFAKRLYDYFVSPADLSELPQNEDAVFTIEEDVTKVFQEGYPSAGIREVKIRGKALLMEYKLQ